MVISPARVLEVRIGERGKAHDRLLADLQMLDLLRLDLRIDHQPVVLGHDQHGDFAAADHAADREDVELMHLARHRRTDLDARQALRRRDLALDILVDLVAHVGDLPDHLRMEFVVEAHHLDLLFGDRSARRGDVGEQLAALALDARAVAVERDDAGQRHQLLGVELAHALQLLGDQRQLLLARRALRAEAVDQRFELRDLLGQLRPRRLARRAAAVEDDLLAVDRIPGVRHWIAPVPIRSRGKRTWSAPSRSATSRASSAVMLVERLRHDRQLGAQHGVVEHDQQVACLDAGALAHLELGDDAALGMLHLLGVGLSTAMRPGAMTAPDISASADQAPNPPSNPKMTNSPASAWLRMERSVPRPRGDRLIGWHGSIPSCWRVADAAPQARRRRLPRIALRRHDLRPAR